MPRYSANKTIDVGDVIVTREGPWLVSNAIRLGARMLGTPAFVNHTIIVHHMDDSGTWWGIEGRPGGVGWIDIRSRLDMPLTNANNSQTKTESDRYLIATAAEQLLGMAYDWKGIAADTAEAFHMFTRLWRKAVEWGEDEVPAHVVCSSFADWAYEQVRLTNPGGYARTRMTTPGDWDKFMMDNQRVWDAF